VKTYNKVYEYHDDATLIHIQLTATKHLRSLLKLTSSLPLTFSIEKISYKSTLYSNCILSDTKIHPNTD